MSRLRRTPDGRARGASGRSRVPGGADRLRPERLEVIAHDLGPRTLSRGAVAVIQRFGAALNLNVHIHALVLDGVYVEEDAGTLRFCEVAPPTNNEMDRLLRIIHRRVHRLLARRGVLGDFDEGSTADPWHEEAPVLAGIAAASVQGRRALGARAGDPVRRLGRSAELLALAPSDLGPCHAQWSGFDLHAGVVVPARDRARLERLCRYALRPPVAHERIHLTSEGQWSWTSAIVGWMGRRGWSSILWSCWSGSS